MMPVALENSILSNDILGFVLASIVVRPFGVEIEQ